MLEYVYRYDADLITLSGDITHFGLGDHVDRIFEPVPVEILAVSGNCDPLDVSHALGTSSKITPLNGNIVKRTGWHFCGYSYQDMAIQDILPIVPKEKTILLTHVPPRGILDKTATGNAGDGNINRWVDEFAPALVLTGHIHEARGMERHKNTVFVNPGPIRDGMAAVVDVDESCIRDVVFL